MTLKKVIIAPDSFKGSLSAKQVTDIIAQEMKTAFPDCTIIKMPIADGGEGSVETIISTLGGTIHRAQVLSPDNRLISASFGITPNKIAVLEMAQSSGITKQLNLNPMTSNTYGFGQLISSALDLGAIEFMLCIGGSATTDGGTGMAAALGVRFLDENENSFIPTGGTLSNIKQIDISGIDNRIAESRFTVMCDVCNPLYGAAGAAFVYAPQKGATPEQVQVLDAGLRSLSTILQDIKLEITDLANIPGAGAAGGLGAGCIAFLSATLKSGIELILELCQFEKHINDTNLIITGEGKLDSQSFSGKVLSGIKRKSADVPIISICGICDYDKEELKANNVKAYEISKGIPIEQSLSNPEKYIRVATKKALSELK